MNADQPPRPLIPRRPTPITNKISFESDADAVAHIKARLRLPAATWIVRIGGMIAVGGLGLCWINPNIGAPIVTSSVGDEPFFVPFSTIVGGATCLSGFAVMLFGRYLRHRRKIEVLKELRGTRYVMLVSSVISRMA